MQPANLKIDCYLIFYIALAIGCSDATTNQKPLAAATAPNLQQVTITLPHASGYETYERNCLICHSASYVQNQPPLPEEKWKSIVTKMQKTFGAPVSDSAAQVIVQYLATIKGKR